jgi:hypothetical protein
MLAWGMPLATVAAALVLYFGARPTTFRARGRGATVLEPVLEMVCRDRGCPSGSTVMFRASGVTRAGFLSAWATPEYGGQRIWYFPTDSGESPPVEAREGPQLLNRGVRLGAEQPPGRYRVHLVLSLRPLTRAELSSPPKDALLAEDEGTLELSP